MGCAFALTSLGGGANAAMVASRTGPAAGGGGLSIAYQYGPDQYSSVLAVGWSLTLEFDNVTITAPFGVGDNRPFEANAYLTTRIGPGTTVADQIAATTFAFPQIFTGTPYPDVTLFTGLSLTPGTYYLTVIGAPGSSGGWGNTNAPVFASDDPGATTSPVSGLFYLSNDGHPGNGNDPATYAPATTFITNANGQFPLFTATGNIVPEPSALALLALTLGMTVRRQRETRG